MSVTREDILKALSRVSDPATGKDLVAADMVRAPGFDPETGLARFILEVDPARGKALEPLLKAAEAAVSALPGVTRVSGVLTAHGPAATPSAAAPARAARPAPDGPAPSLKLGRHPTPQASKKLAGVDRILAVASGKGGVGKSTLSANLAVALAAEGRRVGLLDADIHGPSQARMMGVSDRPKSDGETILPLHAHGVTVMSIGLMLPEDEAVIWRGPMLMGALQQMMNQVRWGDLDVLIVDLPPGTGDVQLSLCQKAEVTGALIVSTPQDVALLDAKKAVAMFRKLDAPILGMIENMSGFVCPHCGGESHIFGHDGAKEEAGRLGLPFLGAIPLHLAIRVAGDDGAPIVARDPDGPQAAAFRALARRLIGEGKA